VSFSSHLTGHPRFAAVPPVQFPRAVGRAGVAITGFFDPPFVASVHRDEVMQIFIAPNCSMLGDGRTALFQKRMMRMPAGAISCVVSIVVSGR